MGELWITGNSLTTISCIKNYGKKINFSLISVGESISSVNPGLTQKLVGSEPVEKVAQSLTLRRAGEDSTDTVSYTHLTLPTSLRV